MSQATVIKTRSMKHMQNSGYISYLDIKDFLKFKRTYWARDHIRGEEIEKYGAALSLV